MSLLLLLPPLAVALLVSIFSVPSCVEQVTALLKVCHCALGKNPENTQSSHASRQTHSEGRGGGLISVTQVAAVSIGIDLVFYSAFPQTRQITLEFSAKWLPSLLFFFLLLLKSLSPVPLL